MKRLHNLALGLVSLSLMTTSCNSKYGKSADGATTIKYELENDLPKGFKEVIPTVIGDYNARYIPGKQKYREVTVKDTVCPIFFNGKDSFTYGAMGWYQTIQLNSSAFAIFNNVMTIRGFRDNIAHEYFHSFCPPDRTEIVDSFILNGKMVIGYHGLFPSFSQDGEPSTLDEGIIDEAAAEALAAILYPDYASKSSEYLYAGGLMVSIINAKWISPVELLIAEGSNDLPYVVGKVINKQRASVTHDDITVVVHCFMKVATNHDIKSGLLEITNIRGEKQDYNFK